MRLPLRSLRRGELTHWIDWPNLNAAIAALLPGTPESPDIYRQSIQQQCGSLVHLTVEVLLDSRS
ncbi:Cation efflux family protein [Halomonas sp. R57-5]|uniref:hypothetical protein n=1 Tax=Halomonas sp. R57-5 TaxID=1610576 RepID=UPI0005FCB12C|nr:hypothetical protein [Halomonas sp. R57-5]CEP33869.1 Cation efflux family protein [Halomonas sp. R57-5]